MQSRKVCASAWQDRKVVMIMYTNSDPQCVTLVPRRLTNGSREEVSCPLGITSYNKNMAAVDKGDQSRGYYHCSIKSRKFYKYIYYLLFDVTIRNAFILDRGWSGATEITIKQFRSQLAKELIGEYCSRYRAGYNGSMIKPIPFSHFPMKITATSPGLRNRGRCTYCYQQKKRCDSQWSCHECGVWLCPPGSGAAMSVAYGCATLEVLLP